MKKKLDFIKFKQILPYILSGIAILAIVFVGSTDKSSYETTLNLGTLASENYAVSTDQISELYIIADLSDALSLASSEDLAYNYVAATSIFGSGQSTTDKIEKPTVVDVSNLSRGVVSYVVSDGESMNSIASKFGLSTDQIRWSNGLKNTNLSAGTTLYLTKNVSGIVYTVKGSDTIESIASKYGSTAANIIALNNLEISGISEGMKIAIEGGVLPNTERPEYVAPRRASTYTYLGNTSQRQNITVVGYYYNLGGTYARGQCTQWAWYKRQDLPNTLGNANTWAKKAAAIGYTVNHTPSAGAVFQTPSGAYGHVGYVESVNEDGSIIVTEMNYDHVKYRVVRSTIPANIVSNFNYIH